MVTVIYSGYPKKGPSMPRRSLSAIAAILGAGVLMIGAAGCGGSDTAAPATTTQVETVAAPAATTAPAAAPATTVTVDQNNNNQNDQNNNNQNDDNQNNDNTNQTPAQQKAECLAHNKGYPENCADIP